MPSATPAALETSPVRYAYTLDRLLAPVPTEEFRDKYWERDFLFLSRNDKSFYKSLFSLKDVDRCIFSRQTDSRRALTVAPPSGSGQPARRYRISEITMDSLYSSFHSGATIRLESVQESWAPVALLVAALEDALAARLNVNLYLTPADSQGFKLHYDSHDTLILQVDGVKEWSIYAPEIRLPVETSTFSGLKEVATVKVDESSARLLRNVRLETGDLLYIPRGFPHKAVAAGAASLHLTLGIQPVYWLDFLKVAIERACVGEPSLRHSLAPGFLTDPAVRDRMRAVFGSVLQQACEKANFDEALEILARERFAARPNPAEGHFSRLAIREGMEDGER